MRLAVRYIDYLLRLHGRIFEFSQDPEIILRLQLMPAPHSVTIGNLMISRGDPILALHVWNERMPKIPLSGADLPWALQLRHRLIRSFSAIAQVMQEYTRYDQIRALYGESALFSFSGHAGGRQMMQHLGFTVLPYYRPLGHFGEFWENLFSWSMMWSFNTASLYTRAFWRLQRSEIWITRSDFLRRFD